MSKSKRGIAADTKRAIKTPGDKVAVSNGCWFDVAAADSVCHFFETFLCHSKGQWAGQPFVLQPWQRDDFLRPLFGWMNPKGKRRFRIAYIEIPKKNGKSATCSGLSLYLCAGDAEPGAEVYDAAADKKQAGIVFEESKKMVKASKDLQKYFRVTDSKKRIDFGLTDSYIQVISSEAYTAEGLNIHGLVFDELHAQKSRELWDALRYGGAAREQSLLTSITTAGWDVTSICYEQHEYAEKVIKGDIIDDAFFGLIYAADPEEDWRKPAAWKRANPSYGVTINEREMAQACKEAQESPVKENGFKRYRLNLWTEQAERWLLKDDWIKCTSCHGDPVKWRAKHLKKLQGKRCLGGLDLGSTSDLTALALFFGGNLILPWFWCPSGAVEKKDNVHRDLYAAWVRQGFLTLTEGDVTDYNRVRADIKALPFGIQEVAVDRLFQGAQLCTDLMADGFEIVEFGQGFASMAAPCKRFEELVKSQGLDHGNNPILGWMASNVTVKTDPAGNMKPEKPKRNSPFKIDGIVACIMALGRVMCAGDTSSVYEKRGIRTV